MKSVTLVTVNKRFQPSISYASGRWQRSNAAKLQPNDDAPTPVPAVALNGDLEFSLDDEPSKGYNPYDKGRPPLDTLPWTGRRRS